MTTDPTVPTVGPRLTQTAHLVLAALAAVVIAVVVQGWPSADPPCEAGPCAPSHGEG